MAEFTLENFGKAIELFEEGFREEPEPVFLYNIAQAHRLAGHPAEALKYYKKYLALMPTAKNRPEVEEHVANLEKAVASTPLPAKPEPAPPQPVKPEPEVKPVITPVATTTWCRLRGGAAGGIEEDLGLGGRRGGDRGGGGRRGGTGSPWRRRRRTMPRGPRPRAATSRSSRTDLCG